MSGKYDAAIVGGGNLGLWTAYCLAQRGAGRIVVCERAWAGFGATTRSAGVVRQQGGSVTAVKLGKLSRELYRALGDEVGLDSGFVQTGYYVLAESDDEAATFQELVALRQSCGVQNEWVDAAEGRRRFPALDWSRFVGGTYTPDHLPIIDQPEPGLFVLAAGGHGMMWGPALGQKMAELIVEGAVEDLPAEEIRLARFASPRARADAIALHFPDE